GARRVRLRWRFADGSEALGRPRLELPRLEGAAAGPTAWSVEVPAGFQAGAADGGEAGVAGSAELDLRRAEAQLRLSAVLADRARGGATDPAAQLALAQKRFYHFCRHAEHSLTLAAAEGRDIEPLRERLRQLHEENRRLAAGHGFEPARAEAERQARAGTLVTLPQAPARAGTAGPGTHPAAAETLPRGTPIYWQAEPGAEAPRPHLAAASVQELRRSVAATGLLLVVCLAVWVLARFAGLVDWARTFWPEQIALLGCLAWQTFGPSLGILFFILLGVCARLIYLGQWALARLRRRASVEPAPADGSGTAAV
ncbi:MAG TPA: hypothetical protein VFA26_00020, partial [Gemmataceae bacterium]|nr:hypothetical protein [Gemmataceae bacterium]